MRTRRSDDIREGVFKKGKGGQETNTQRDASALLMVTYNELCQPLSLLKKIYYALHYYPQHTIVTFDIYNRL